MDGEPTLGRLFLTTLKIGGFTFGGGWAMIPLIREEFVKKRGWICEGEFIDVVSIAQSFPGPIMVNVSVMCGKRLLGRKGAFIALLGSVLPSLLVILLIAIFLSKYEENPYARSFLNGMRPALLSVLIYAIFEMRKSVLKDRLSFVIASLALITVSLLKVTPFWVIICGAIFGVLYYFAGERLR